MRRFMVFALFMIVIVFLNISGVEGSQFDPDEILERAARLYISGDIAASIDEYLKIVNSQLTSWDPDIIEARKNLATIYEEQGDYIEAARQYETLLIFQDDLFSRLSLGVAYYNLGLLELAESQFRYVVNSKKAVPAFLMRDAFFFLGKTSLDLLRYSQAISHFRQAAEVDPHFALGFFYIGETYFKMGEFAEAINHYFRATNIERSLIGIRSRLGIAYFKLGSVDQALTYLRGAIDEHPDDVEVTKLLEQIKKDYPEKYIESEIAYEPPPIKEVVSFDDVSIPENTGPEIRSGILPNIDEVFFRIGSSFSVELDGKVVYSGKAAELCRVYANNSEHVLEVGGKVIPFSTNLEVTPDQYVTIYIHNMERYPGLPWLGYEDRQYRGALDIIPRDGGITVVNVVGLEELLLSAVPSEMPASWPMEALKTQAVAARSYVIANKGRYASQGFDIRADHFSIVYRGVVSEHPRTTTAVQETTGEVLMYGGRVVEAVFTANAGGHTENSVDIWGGDFPYLSAISTERTPSTPPQSPYELKTWLMDRPPSYSFNPDFGSVTGYRWQLIVPVAVIEERLSMTGIKAIIPASRTAAGTVKSVRVVSDEEVRIVERAMRTNLGGLKSSRFWVHSVYERGELTAFLFYGSGWGHGVGMDQISVATMASENYLYKEILSHFYTGVSIEKAY